MYIINAINTTDTALDCLICNRQYELQRSCILHSFSTRAGPHSLRKVPEAIHVVPGKCIVFGLHNK